jgi:hypothetical protein
MLEKCKVTSRSLTVYLTEVYIAELWESIPGQTGRDGISVSIFMLAHDLQGDFIKLYQLVTVKGKSYSVRPSIQEDIISQ